MTKIRYWRLKLFLVPLIAVLAALTASGYWPDFVREIAAVLSAGSVALYALVNETPRKPGSDSEMDPFNGE